MSKIEINVLDFITEEHKKEIRKNLSEAIKKIDYDKLVKELERVLMEDQLSYLADYIFEDLDIVELQKEISDFFLNSLKEKLKS